MVLLFAGGVKGVLNRSSISMGHPILARFFLASKKNYSSCKSLNQ